jgi:hypothetical protein
MRVILVGRLAKLMKSRQPEPGVADVLPHVWDALDRLRRIPKLQPSAAIGERRFFWSSASGRTVRIRLKVIGPATVHAYDFRVD